MTPNEILDEVRWNAGSPTEAEVSTFRIKTALRQEADTYAQEMGRHQREEFVGIPLVANTYLYRLPTDFVTLLASFWGGQKLPWTKLEEFQSRGIDYMSASPSNPSELAISGQNFLIYPPPSETAVANYPTVNMRYVATAIGWDDAEGLPGFQDAEIRTIILRVAKVVIVNKPNQTQADMMRLQSLNERIGPRTEINQMNTQSGIMSPTLGPIVPPKNYGRG